MAKVKQRPLQKVVRVGSLIDYEFVMSEFGTDENGAFAVVDVSPGIIPNVFMVTEITTAEVITDFLDQEQVDMAERLGKVAAEPRATAIPKEKTATEKKQEQKAAQQFEKEERASRRKNNVKPVGPVAVTETIDVQLTGEERILAAKSAASMSGLAADQKAKLKSYVAEQKAEIKAIDEKILRAQQAHNTGLEIRSVTCMQHFDPANLSTWFVYNGAEYGRRAMSKREERETGAASLFGDAPMLPNKVDPSQSVISGGDELAKIAAAHNDKMAKQKKERDTSATNGHDENSEIRNVMNSEKSKKSKHDHVST